VTAAGLVAYAAALGLAAAVPGPGVLALVGRAIASGFGAGMAFAAGLILGDLTYLAAAVLGLTRAAEALGDVFVVVRICAGLYLGYLAVQLWCASARTSRVAVRSAGRPAGSFAAGLTVTLANPKTMVFYLAVLPTLLDLETITQGGFVALAAVTTAVLAAVMTPYAALASGSRRALCPSRYHRRLSRSAAALLAGAAVWTIARRA
jgi:threonine/homoserine/homoserine lactone efflux protein